MLEQELIEHLKKTIESHGGFHVDVDVNCQLDWMGGFRTDEPDNIITIKFRRYKDEIKQENRTTKKEA